MGIFVAFNNEMNATSMKITNAPALTIDRDFEVDGRCMDCLFKGFERLMEKYDFSYDDRQAFFGFYNLTIARGGNRPMPELHRDLTHYFCDISGVPDLFIDEKSESNQEALTLYKKWRLKVLETGDPFNAALRLSIAGNIMDYGPSADFDLEQTIAQVMKEKFAIDASDSLRQQIKVANTILYLGDNAGEIVFDKLFIEMLMHPHLTYAVRGGPILNDATMIDAREVGMDWVADVISNGYDAPSTILDHCSEAFMNVYKNADLIISKGQGNLEGLIHENDPRIFFLLMVKCDVMAEQLHVEKGSMVVYNPII